MGFRLPPQVGHASISAFFFLSLSLSLSLSFSLFLSLFLSLSLSHTLALDLDFSLVVTWSRSLYCFLRIGGRVPLSCLYGEETF
jgi:hypothetical protein